MALVVEVIPYELTGAASQVISLNNFDATDAPKCVLMFIAGGIAAGSGGGYGLGTAHHSFGWASAVNEQSAVAFTAIDNNTSNDADFRNQWVLGLLTNGTGGTTDTISLSALTPTSLTISQSGATNCRCTFMVLGGTDLLNAYFHSFASNSSPGTQQTTGGMGWTPNGMIYTSIGQFNPQQGLSGGVSYLQGMTDHTGLCRSMFTAGYSGSTGRWRQRVSDQFSYLTNYFNDGIQQSCSFVNFIADGMELNWHTTFSAFYYQCLWLEFSDPTLFKVGHELGPALTTPPNQTVSIPVGHEPQAAIVMVPSIPWDPSNQTNGGRPYNNGQAAVGFSEVGQVDSVVQSFAENASAASTVLHGYKDIRSIHILDDLGLESDEAALLANGNNLEALFTISSGLEYSWFYGSIGKAAVGPIQHPVIIDFTGLAQTSGDFTVVGATHPVIIDFTGLAQTSGDFTVVGATHPVVVDFTGLAQTSGDFIVVGATHPVVVDFTGLAQTSGDFIVVSATHPVVVDFTGLAVTSGDLTVLGPAVQVTFTGKAETRGNVGTQQAVEWTATGVARTLGNFTAVGQFDVALSITASARITGDLAVRRPLSMTMTGVAQPQGNLSVVGVAAVAMTTTAKAQPTGNLTVGQNVELVTTAKAQSTGNLTVGQALELIATATHTSLGNFSVIGTVSVAMSITAKARPTGDLQIVRPLGLITTAKAQTVGNLIVGQNVELITTAQATTSGQFSLVRPLALTIEARARTQGNFTIGQAAALTITAVARTAGGFVALTPDSVSLVVTAQGHTQNNLTIVIPLGLTITGVAQTAGDLVVVPPASVALTITAVGTTAGDLVLVPPVPVDLTITAVAQTQGWPRIIHPLTFTITGVGTTFGNVPVGVLAPNPCRLCVVPGRPFYVVPKSPRTCILEC